MCWVTLTLGAYGTSGDHAERRIVFNRGGQPHLQYFKEGAALLRPDRGGEAGHDLQGERVPVLQPGHAAHGAGAKVLQADGV